MKLGRHDRVLLARRAEELVVVTEKPGAGLEFQQQLRPQRVDDADRGLYCPSIRPGIEDPVGFPVPGRDRNEDARPDNGLRIRAQRPESRAVQSGRACEVDRQAGSCIGEVRDTPGSKLAFHKPLRVAPCIRQVQLQVGRPSEPVERSAGRSATETRFVIRPRPREAMGR